jgi:hypothetical protein
MITHNGSTGAPCGADFQIAHPSMFSSFVWLVILMIAMIGGTFMLSCVTPFAALAVALAGTVGLRAALSTMALVWFTNQALGFFSLGFPWTPSVFVWGLMIGAAVLLATIVAENVLRHAPARNASARLGFALLLSFVMYEVALLPVAWWFDGWEMFAPAIIAQLAFINVVWLVAMVALNEVFSALGKPCLGRVPRLIGSS